VSAATLATRPRRLRPRPSQVPRIAHRLRPNTQRSGWLRLPKSAAGDPGVKPVVYLPVYEQLLGDLRRQAFTLLELGVWAGDSLEMWRDGFPRATIIGVDVELRDIHLGDRVHIVRGDQTDAALMRQIRDEFAPGGFDVIVDDASHLGTITARSLQVLYAEHLRPGGLYCIEDWGTGYVADWPDGGRIDARVEVERLDSSTVPMRAEANAPIPMPSHDLGTVGVIKRLIDHTARGTVRAVQPEAIGDALEIESMTVWDGIVVLRKPDA
jgi:hypothetical protein